MELEEFVDFAALVIIVIVTYAVTFIKRRKQPRPFTLATRKEWLRDYFCVGLGMTGPVLDSLWHMDPWLAGPGESTAVEMQTFAKEFIRLCVGIYNFKEQNLCLPWRRYDLIHKGGGIAIIFYTVNYERWMKIQISDKHHNSHTLAWSEKGVFTKKTFGLLRNTPVCLEHDLPSFARFRWFVLECAHDIATKHKFG